MNIQPVGLVKLRTFFNCVKCGIRIVLGTQYEGHLRLWGVKQSVYADLDGAPFTDYYCRDCAARVSPNTFRFTGGKFSVTDTNEKTANTYPAMETNPPRH